MSLLDAMLYCVCVAIRLCFIIFFCTLLLCICNEHFSGLIKPDKRYDTNHHQWLPWLVKPEPLAGSKAQRAQVHVFFPIVSFCDFGLSVLISQLLVYGWVFESYDTLEKSVRTAFSSQRMHKTNCTRMLLNSVQELFLYNPLDFLLVSTLTLVVL